MENTPLFGKFVNLDETLFFIHGIVHETPWLSISKEFKNSIKDSLGNKNIICEDGLTSWFTNAKSFNEAQYFGFNKISFSEYMYFLKQYFKMKYSKKSVVKSDLIKKVGSLKNLDGLKKIREELFSKYPLEPNGMNYLISKSCGGDIKKPNGKLPNRIKRYIYEARESIKYAKENSLNELHIVVGCAHELPLEYLLNNPKILNNPTLKIEGFK